jgi:hypothetical protein
VRRLLPALTALAALISAPSALAASYDVTGTGDLSDPPPCTELVPGSVYQCSTLRAALFASDATPGVTDSISLHAGTYTLSNGALTINDSVVITGVGARATSIQGSGSDRVLTVAAGASASVANLTIQGGATGGNGGNILV